MSIIREGSQDPGVLAAAVVARNNDIRAKKESREAIVAGSIVLAVLGTFGVLGMLHAKHILTLPKGLLKIGTVKAAAILLAVGGAAGLGFIAYGIYKRPAASPRPAASEYQIALDDVEERLSPHQKSLLNFLKPGEYVEVWRDAIGEEAEPKTQGQDLFIHYAFKDGEGSILHAAQEATKPIELTRVKFSELEQRLHEGTSILATAKQEHLV